jgi:peptidoglycan/LPS O-acetylase OafA/YrhL
MKTGERDSGPATGAAAYHLRYRPDIDGLRAVAVILVVFFHLNVPGFAGGFIGVDIFFVISGFLITAVIRRDLEAGEFSLAAFYERRVRRILPALFALIAATFVLSILLFLPDALAGFGRSAMTTALFISNVQFWRESGYFGTAATLKPLLHTWSLAVEEQFYLAFPLLLLLLRKWRRTTLLLLLATLAILSFFLSVWLVRWHVYAAFYSGPSRAWELGIGSVLAVGGWAPPRRRIVRSGLAVLGGLLVAYGALTFSRATPFPGASALFPCLGAALVIWAGSGASNAVSRLLASKPFVFVGLISYSLYLWSWPIEVYFSYYARTSLRWDQTALAMLLSVAAAILSWRFVERPFRGKSGLFRRPALFRLAAATAGVIVAAGAALSFSDGLPQRMSPQTARSVARYLAAESDINPLQASCYDHLTAAQIAAGDLCRFGDPKPVPSFLFWGDSHTDALLPGIAQLASRHGRAGLWAYQSGCLPLLNVQQSAAPDCEDHNKAMLQVALRPQVREVVLHGLWAQGVEGTTYIDNSAAETLTDAKSPLRIVSTAVENRAVFHRGLERLVRALTTAGKRVVIIASIPELQWYLPEAMAKNMIWGRDVDLRIDTQAFLRRQKNTFSEFAFLQRRYGVTVLYPHAALCDARKCRIWANDHLLYRDMHHLSKSGALYVAPSLEQGLFAATPR